MSTSTAFVRMPAVCEALGVKSIVTARKWCERYGVEIIELNSRSRAVRKDELERGLAAAAGKDA